jgi:sensor histidine kinase YesM
MRSKKNKEIENRIILLFILAATFVLPFFLFLPIVKVEIYQVYMYDLTRTLLREDHYSVVEMMSDQDCFGHSWFVPAFSAIILCYWIFSLFPLSKEKKSSFLFLMIGDFFLFCFAASFLLLFSKLYDLPIYDKVPLLSEKAPAYTTFIRDETYYKNYYMLRFDNGLFFLLGIIATRGILSAIGLTSSFMNASENLQIETIAIRV